MELKNNYKKAKFEKLYLFTYIFAFSLIMFFRISQYGMAMTASSSNHSWFYILYTIAAIFGVTVNLFIFLVSNYKNIYAICWMIILITFATIPILFGTSLMSLPYLLIYLLINNAKLVHPKKIVKYDFWMRITMFIVIVIMYIFNLYPAGTEIPVLSRSSNLNLLRYSFGFIHPNSLALFALTIFISFVLAYTKQARKISSIFIIIVIYIIIITLTDSRVFEYSGIILIIGLIFSGVKTFRFFVKKSLMSIMTICLIVGCIYLYLPYLGSGLEQFLNVLTSDRLSIGVKAFEYYPLRLGGYVSTPLLDMNSVNIDDMYMSYMLKFGIVGFIILQGYFYYCGYISKKMNLFFGNISMIVITTALITINTNTLFTPMMFIVSSYYFNRKEKNNEIMD